MAGETVALATSTTVAALRQMPDGFGSGVFPVKFPRISFSSTNNETNDVMEFGYLPAYAVPIAVLWQPTDMDTNVSPAVVHKVTVGSTDIATGLTGAQTGTANLAASARYTASSSPALVKVTSTTAAATGAAGTADLTILCARFAG